MGSRCPGSIGATLGKHGGRRGLTRSTLRVEAERDVAQTEASNWQAEAAKAQAMLSDTEAQIAAAARTQSVRSFTRKAASA